MKLIRRNKKSPGEIEPSALSNDMWDSIKWSNDFCIQDSPSWKVLVVDDEPDVHSITTISLKHFKFGGKGIRFFHAKSAEEAKLVFEENRDIAAALIDVVMETENAGLDLVDYIRNSLGNHVVRLIIRTGQPGVAPERYVIERYDIDDYKDKTELTARKLHTALRSAIKAYRDICIIQRNRLGLEKILNAAPKLYRLQPMQEFLEGVLFQIIGLCNIGNNNMISTTDSFLAITENESKMEIRAGTGRFKESISKDEMTPIVGALFEPENKLPEKSLLIPLKTGENVIGCIYIEDTSLTSDADLKLIHILANQCAAALHNLLLYHDVEQARELNERKNRMLAIAAHDIRNPLSGVLSLLRMLSKSLAGRLDTSEQELMQMGKSVIYNALNMVSNLLDVSKIESGNLILDRRPANISKLIERCIEESNYLSEPKNISVVYTSKIDSQEVAIDKSKIKQVMSNLISNAVKYSHSGTVVRIQTELQADGRLLVSVADQGQGVPESELPKLFQPFSKTSVKPTAGEPSTGLGLMICKKIVEAHGGRIWVDSVDGEGSVFYWTIPLDIC